MRKAALFGCAIALMGCTEWPPEEQQAVQCAQKQLAGTPGVSGVKLYSGKRPIVSYSYVDLTGKSVTSRVRIEGRAAPGKPISYNYEIISEEWMGSGSSSHYDVRKLMADCNLGLIVVTD